MKALRHEASDRHPPHHCNASCPLQYDRESLCAGHAPWSHQAHYGHRIAAPAVHDTPQCLVFLCLEIESSQMDAVPEGL